MTKKFIDPFGGVHSEVNKNALSPKIDKEESLKEINDSIKKWDEKKKRNLPTKI